MSSYTINLNEKAENELKEITKILHLENEEAAIRKALGLLNFVAKEIREGGLLIIENKRANSRREIKTI